MGEINHGWSFKKVADNISRIDPTMKITHTRMASDKVVEAIREKQKVRSHKTVSYAVTIYGSRVVFLKNPTKNNIELIKKTYPHANPTVQEVVDFNNTKFSYCSSFNHFLAMMDGYKPFRYYPTQVLSKMEVK